MRKPRRPPFEPIAIVGQSCVLPGALDLAELWTAVAEQRDLTSSAPAGRWGLPRRLALTTPPKKVEDRTWCDRGGYVRGFDDRFDASGFELPADEIRQLDPLFQWVLHCGREALKGTELDDSSRRRTGVVLGNLSFPSVGASRFAESVWLGKSANVGDHEPPAVDPRNHFMSGLPAHLLARALGLGGRAFALDAACASSLVAIKLACDRLHDRRADVMLAGAVSCADDLFIHIGFCALDALSPSGRSRPFHRDADGLLPAEGAAFVALRRLDDAVARGDKILGVIRGIGLSNDGRGGGLLAPSEEGQRRAIRRAYEEAALEPADISLVECHATGTRLGDAAEIRSLGSLYEGLHDVPIGSLKSNLGHLITAAGLAGLLKILAAFRTKTRPPTLLDGPVNAVLEGSPFRLLEQSEPWLSEGPRRAALSAFGFGGNNAHVLVEEWRPDLHETSSPTDSASVSGAENTGPSSPIAIVGLAAMAAEAAETGAFTHALFTGESRLQEGDGQPPAGRAGSIELSLEGLGFPPKDLQQALPQQLALIAAARQALADFEGELPRERTGVLVGMRCDAEIARYGLRWRLAGWTEGHDPEKVEASRDAIVHGLQAAGVVGTMPNMTANRLNSLLDLGGASASISSEETSGLDALELAMRALRVGEIDAALVGATDFSCEPVHEAAVRALIGDRIPGDAATVLVLERLEDAKRLGRRIFAVIEAVTHDGPDSATEDEPPGLRLIRDGEPDARLDLTSHFGHAHAASGLLHVAAAALACHHRALPASQQTTAEPRSQPPRPSPTRPWLSRGERRATVSAKAFAGQTSHVFLRHEPEHSSSIAPTEGMPRIELYCGSDRQEILARLSERKVTGPTESPSDPARLTLVANSAEELESKRREAHHWLSGTDPSLSRQPQGSLSRPGIVFHETPVVGELAFVFTGAGAAYHGMGRQLLLGMPQLMDRLGHRMQDIPAAADWVYQTELASFQPKPLQQLWGSSFLTQAHTELTRGVLGLEPAAVLGYSSGESNSLMAMGVWNDLDALHRDTIECGLFTHELGGDFAAVRRLWQEAGTEAGTWSNFGLQAPVAKVRTAVAGQSRVFLTLISSPDDVVISGDDEACQQVIAALEAPSYPLGYDLAVHCDVVENVADRWLELHRRPTTDVPDIRFYTHSTLGHYQPTRESAAQAILGQAVRTLDFPALVKQAFDDGVRLFVEHGPRSLCSGWIRKILTHHGVPEKDFVAVSLDRRTGSSLNAAAEAVAALLAAGVDLSWEVFHRPETDVRDSTRVLSFPAHWPAVELSSSSFIESSSEGKKATPIPMPDLSEPNMSGPGSSEPRPQFMAPAPSLPPVLDDFDIAAAPLSLESTVVPGAQPASPNPTARAPERIPPDVAHAAPAVAVQASAVGGATSGEPVATSAVMAPVGFPPVGVLAGLSDLQTRLATAQRSFLSSQTALHQQFLALRQRTLSDLLQAHSNAIAGALFVAQTSSAAQSVASQNVPVGPPARLSRPEPVTPPQPAPVPEPTPTAVPTTPTPAVSTRAVSTPAAKNHVAEARVTKAPLTDSAPASAAPTNTATPINGELPGLKLSRQDLEVLASGRISSLFGPLFERQDGYARQTRMPEPPFLLADRVTGIDAEPGTMGTGTIWTETDVRDDSWYLHRGHMPGGLMIEAGQADLLLISWLGIDFLNRNERVYRLLGCELTYRGGLPRPGDTLRYDIHIDGHAQQGDVRIFFFHYDCHIGDDVRLEVRHGQAGFFTDAELDGSAGVLWSPEDEAPPPGRLDPPQALSQHRSFTNEQMHAFADGRILECMGPGFELAAAHSSTPTIQGERMMLLDHITDFDPQGGPWKRGYLRAITPITSDSWIYEGHFKNDPCMPGTLMLEGCFQALSFYLAALGFTLERDGWRFEPVPDETYLMRCRGQAIPTSKELVYELFVHEIVAGPQPTIFADMLCTVDGLKAFHAKRLGLHLVPDWPLEIQPALLAQPFPGGERPEGRPIASVDGFTFDYPSLLACAWGKPSKAFGEMYRIFDGPRQVARLPGPPYHYMSRIASIDGEMGRFQSGAVLEAEYDVPPREWYFSENGHPTMPFAVLMEAGLQPCGWLASYIGSTLTTETDLQFRNLDGTGTLTAEVGPQTGTLTTHVKLVATSSSAGVLIVRFEVEMRDDHQPIFNMQTAFGFFPGEAMKNQVGLPASEEERGWLEKASDFQVDLTARPERFCSGTLGLAGPKLLMLDRVTGYWPDAGKAGLGRLRAEKTVDPSEWFFKAHFFQDPVQPGSLGIEAMVQLLQFYMLQANLGAEIPNPRFEPIATDQPLTWKYRGQVLPTNGLISTEIEIVEVGTDDRGAFALAEASLWVDGKRIYSAKNLGMRIVEGQPRPEHLPADESRQVEDHQDASREQALVPAPAPKPEAQEPTSREQTPAPTPRASAPAPAPKLEAQGPGEEVLDLTVDTWIADHCPTWTIPTLPMMVLVDRLAAAAQTRCKKLRVVGLEDVRVERWVAFPKGALRLKTEIVSEERRGSEVGTIDVRLLVWRDAATKALSRFEVAATGRVLMASNFCSPPKALEPLVDAVALENPYAAGTLFHGPAFQLLRELWGNGFGSSAVLEASAGSVPLGALHPALLDAATHGIPHDALYQWSTDIPADVVAYPQRLSEARFYGPAPTSGTVRCEARFEGYDPDAREAVFHLQLLVGDNPWADMRLREVLLPKGPLGTAPALARRAFLRDRIASPELALSRTVGEQTHLREAEVIAIDWLPGTLARAYGVSDGAAANRTAVTREVAIKDHLARQTETHPSTVAVENDPTDPSIASAVVTKYPFTRFFVDIQHGEDASVAITNHGEPAVDLTPLTEYWADFLGIEEWPVENIYYSLIERFVRRVVITDPEAFGAIHGRSTLFLANHQVGIESLLFSILASALVGTPTVTLAKAEHQVSWLGQLIAHCFSYPGVEDPEVIAFFDRENMRSLPLIIRKLGKRMLQEPRSVAVHCEGTRSLTCRQNLTKLSGSFVDMAMKADAAIVPVRFVGGLPAEPLEERIEFPLGHGQQDYWIGKPILPKDLESLRYKDRRTVVMDAINGLGPSHEDEAPFPPNPDFAAEVEEWIQTTGAAPEYATIYKTLEKLENPGSEVRHLIEGAKAGRLVAEGDEKGRWLAEIARRFFGDTGPRVDVER